MEELKSKDIYNKSFKNSKYLYYEKNNILNNDIDSLDFENYKNQFYHFKEFHYFPIKHKNFYRVNIPHYSFYHYSDIGYSINESSKINLLKESEELKKISKKLRRELKREKNEKIIKNKYIKILEDRLKYNQQINGDNIKYNNKDKNYTKNSNLNKISNNKKNFNYKEYKNKIKEINKNIINNF